MRRGGGGGVGRAAGPAKLIRWGGLRILQQMIITMSSTPEREWAETVGLTAEGAARLRRENLREGHGFIRSGNRILLTAEGVASLSALLALGKNPAAPSEPQGAALAHHVLWVERLTQNPRIVFCLTKKSGGERVRLKVRDSKNFRPGMEVTRCVHLGGDVFSLDGNCPRFPGRF